MSLTEWVEWDKDLFKYNFFKPKLCIKGDLKASPITKNYSLVGTAFDYILRIMISKENAEFVSGAFKTVAEHCINGDKKRQRFINEFKIEQTKFTVTDNISIDEFIKPCLTLAKMDVEYRCGIPISNAELFVHNNDDMEDMRRLISLVDIKQFKAEKQCLLNPTFGGSSRDIGGADADLVIDDTLVDIKTIKNLEFTAGTFRQLMGYYLLHQREDKIFGDIKYLGIYYSRFGILWRFPIEEVNFEIFGDVEKVSNNLGKRGIEYLDGRLETREYFWDQVEDSIKEYQDAPVVG